MLRPLAFLSRSLARSFARPALSALLLLPAGALAYAGSAPSEQQAHAQPTHATIEQSSPSTEAKPALWLLRDEDTQIYLFGTVHFLRPETQWQNPTIAQAFSSADTLMLEIALDRSDAEMAEKIMPLAMSKGAPPLSQQLSPTDRKAYHQAMEKYGLAPTSFDAFKPWFAATTLSLMPAIQAGFNPNKGVESILSKEAKAENKATAALETVEQQLGYFDMLPANLQIRYLNESVKTLDQSTQMLDDMVSMWVQGRTDELAALINESLETSPELHHLLLDKRNENWAAQLAKRLEQPGRIFVAVGSGHLAGKGSVQEYLAKHGLTVQRIYY